MKAFKRWKQVKRLEFQSNIIVNKLFMFNTLCQSWILLTNIFTFDFYSSSSKASIFFIFFFFWFSSIQSFSHVWLFATPWITAFQASMSITNSRSLPKPISIESVMPSSHLILHHPLLLLPSILPSIRVFSNESALLMRWPKHWSFCFRRLVLRSLNILPKRTCKINKCSR